MDLFKGKYFKQNTGSIAVAPLLIIFFGSGFPHSHIWEPGPINQCPVLVFYYCNFSYFWQISEF
jgi:hypothetical protein